MVRWISEEATTILQEGEKSFYTDHCVFVVSAYTTAAHLLF